MYARSPSKDGRRARIGEVLWVSDLAMEWLRLNTYSCRVKWASPAEGTSKLQIWETQLPRIGQLLTLRVVLTLPGPLRPDSQAFPRDALLL